MPGTEFALYGVRLITPSDWTVELNPKSSQEKCDVAFHLGKGSKFYLSWGSLKEAQSRFNSLGDHVDFSLEQVRKGRDVDSLSIQDRKEIELNGHQAISTKVSVVVRSGFMGRNSTARVFLSTHFYCPQTTRFYVVYLLAGASDADEEAMITMYEDVLRSMKCHAV